MTRRIHTDKSNISFGHAYGLLLARFGACNVHIPDLAAGPDNTYSTRQASKKYIQGRGGVKKEGAQTTRNTGTLPRRRATLRTPSGRDYKLSGCFSVEGVFCSPWASARATSRCTRSPGRRTGWGTGKSSETNLSFCDLKKKWIR